MQQASQGCAGQGGEGGGAEGEEKVGGLWL